MAAFRLTRRMLKHPVLPFRQSIALMKDVYSSMRCVACSYQPRELILQHFPNIAQQCQQFGLDITREPIPVAPAQHYMCGGVKVCALSQHMSGFSPALAHVLSLALFHAVA